MTAMTKKSTFLQPALIAGLAAGFLALVGPAAHAQMSANAPIVNFSLPTTGLIQGATYTIEYQLNRGVSGANATVSSVNVSQFVFGPVSPGTPGTPTTGPGASAPTASTGSSGTLQNPPVTLSDAATSAADFQQSFVNGQTMSFRVDGSQLMAPVPAGGAPDSFIFDLVDPNGNVVPTTAGASNALFTLTQNPAGTYMAQGYSYTDQTGNGNGTFMSQVTPAPELGTSISFGLMLGLFGLGLLRSRFAKRGSQA